MDNKHIGQRIVLKGKHQHAGEEGIIISEERTLIGYGFRVELDKGGSCFVFSGSQYSVKRG